MGEYYDDCHSEDDEDTRPDENPDRHTSPMSSFSMGRGAGR